MSETPQTQLSFHVEGLDCAEEVAVLKGAVGPLVGGEEHLVFDVLRGKMTVLARTRQAVAEEEVCSAVSSTGMRARRWEDGERALVSAANGEGAWARHGRNVLCGASGVLLGAAFLVHAGSRGLVAALHAEPGNPLPVGALVLYSASILAGVWFVAPKAFYAVRALRPDMNLLMLVAVAGAMVLGEWLEAGSVSFLFSLALGLERWSVGRARRAIESLLDLSPPVARVVDETTGDAVERPVAEVAVKARVRVRPGEKIPLDGTVTAGRTSVDQSSITGESVPVVKETGDPVYAGTVNGDGAFELQVTHPARDTTLARIIHLVEEAQGRRAPSERWVDGFARLYTPLMMFLAVGLATVPPLVLGGGWTPWLYRALVLLVIACPCALVLSTPVSVVAGLASAARSGVLIKGGSFLEAPARFEAMAFDKTGTLTHGHPHIRDLVPLDGHSEEDLLSRAAALEKESTHPLARCVLAAAKDRGLDFPAATDVRTLPGLGAEGLVDGRRFWIGNHRLMEERGAETEAAHRLAVELEDQGKTLLALGTDDHVCGLLATSDQVRPQAARTLRELKALGVRRVVLLTGDHRRTARVVADALGVDAFEAGLLPEEKVESVRRLESEVGHVAMVGDGVNDAPALAAASVGIAMGSAGSDAAIETADIALMSDELARLPWLIRHSRRTLRVIRQNIAFALAVKAAFIALAGAGLATLWMAIAADMGASLLVIANALRLLRGGAPSP